MRPNLPPEDGREQSDPGSLRGHAYLYASVGGNVYGDWGSRLGQPAPRFARAMLAF